MAMQKTRKLFLSALAVCFLVPAVLGGQVRAASSADGVLVGRISYVEGELLRYVPEEKDWVATVKDAPFALNDSLYTEKNSRTELVLPNRTTVRMGEDTQIQLIALNKDLLELDVASGTVRFYNRSSDALIKATSPFGYVTAPAGTSFDLYVNDQSLEVVALQGKVEFVSDRDETRYEVMAGGASIVAGDRRVTSGEAHVDASWDDWNRERDRLWARRTETRGESIKYLPETLHDDAYELDQYGRWETVYYDGAYRTMWRPVDVEVGWAPYTVGRWSVYYGDNCWIPYEPFGYVTHHYGAWVFIDSCSCWYWAPPVFGIGFGVGPFWGIGYAWYPGRVGWIYSGWGVGWFPLAPYEPYYSYRRWGPGSTVINNVNITNINVNRYKYVNHAVVINKNDLYKVSNYNNISRQRFNRQELVSKFRASPVVNDQVVSNYSKIQDKYRVTNIEPKYKPGVFAAGRIEQNYQRIKQMENPNFRSVNGDVARNQVVRFVDNPKTRSSLTPSRFAGENRQPVMQDGVRKQGTMPGVEGTGVFRPPKPQRYVNEGVGRSEPQAGKVSKTDIFRPLNPRSGAFSREIRQPELRSRENVQSRNIRTAERPRREFRPDVSFSDRPWAKRAGRSIQQSPMERSYGRPMEARRGGSLYDTPRFRPPQSGGTNFSPPQQQEWRSRSLPRQEMPGGSSFFAGQPSWGGFRGPNIQNNRGGFHSPGGNWSR